MGITAQVPEGRDGKVDGAAPHLRMRAVETGRGQYRDMRPVDAELGFGQFDDARVMVRHQRVAHPAAADAIDDRIHNKSSRFQIMTA